MPTWAEIREEIKTEYDLVEETFVSDDELLSFANEAIEDIETEIHSLHDKYFASEFPLALVSGTSVYDKPTDIYANKITGIYYNNGSDKYEIKELKDLKLINNVQPEDLYRYRIVNTKTDGTKIKLYPESRETSSSNVIVHYRRKAIQFLLDTDKLDIPEAKSFIKQYIMDKVVNKERMTPDAPESAALTRKRKLLLSSLENMIDDDNTEPGIDLTFFEEHI